jgi:hypothetical protein
VATEKFKSVS